MSGKQFRPLLPATNPDSVSSDSTNSSNPTLSNLTLKRRPVNVACESCRKRKSRCNGGKPVCEMCARRGVKACSYADGDGLKQENFELKVENEQLHDLLNRIRTLSEKEAQEVFTRLRTAEDPLAVLGFIKDADLLLGDPGGVQAIISPSSHLEAAESRVLDGSRFEIPARPWTVVAADGVVSGLISSFFSWADTFLYPFIDREAFLDDMRRGQPEVAKFCSCFLVNTICASSCVSLLGRVKPSVC